MMIDLKTLRQLVKLMVDNDLTELDVQAEQEKVKLRRQGEQPQVHYVSANPGNPTPVYPPIAESASSAIAQPTGGEEVASAASKVQTINSPMVGTFFSSPSPDAKPYISTGDHVETETVVCIIEAMKVFNEIKAETRGRIKRVLVENGQVVEFNTPLFEIEAD